MVNSSGGLICLKLIVFLFQVIEHIGCDNRHVPNYPIRPMIDYNIDHQKKDNNYIQYSRPFHCNSSYPYAGEPQLMQRYAITTIPRSLK